MKLSSKVAMAWALFSVWTTTVLLTILLNRDVAVLTIVSGVFGTVVIWFYKIRQSEKKDGVE